MIIFSTTVSGKRVQRDRTRNDENYYRQLDDSVPILWRVKEDIHKLRQLPVESWLKGTKVYLDAL